MKKLLIAITLTLTLFYVSNALTGEPRASDSISEAAADAICTTDISCCLAYPALCEESYEDR